MSTGDEPPYGDGAVKAKTGRDWAEWCVLLDAEGAAGLTHQQIVGIVHGKYGGGPWWSQMVTVGYERLRGLRRERQKSDGSFSASVSKTLPIGAARAHAFFTDGVKRKRWLDEDVEIRTATSPKSVRIVWPDESRINVWITAKGEAKCSVAVEHDKLPDADAVDGAKDYWKSALDRLNRELAGPALAE